MQAELFLKAKRQSEGTHTQASVREEQREKSRMHKRSKIKFYMEQKHSQDARMPARTHTHVRAHTYVLTDCFKSHI